MAALMAATAETTTFSPHGHLLLSLGMNSLWKIMMGLLFDGPDDHRGTSTEPADSQDLQHSWPALPENATVLFLDFDGVMHCAANESFERMPQLEWLLEQRPDVGLILSTDWRLNTDPDYLRRRFPDAVWDRIFGVTPELKYARPQREMECASFAKERGVVRFLAVDDDADVFSPDCPFLFLTNRYRALDWDTARSLLTLLNERFPAHPSLIGAAQP